LAIEKRAHAQLVEATSSRGTIQGPRTEVSNLWRASTARLLLQSRAVTSLTQVVAADVLQGVSALHVPARRPMTRQLAS